MTFLKVHQQKLTRVINLQSGHRFGKSLRLRLAHNPAEFNIEAAIAVEDQQELETNLRY